MLIQPLKRSSLILAMIFIWISHFLVDFMIGIWPVYKSLAQLDLARAGLIVAGGAFIGEGSQMVFGTLSDRGYRQAIIIFGVIAATASAFFGYMNHYFLLFTMYLLTCIGSGAFHPSAAGLVNSLVPQRRGLLMTIFASGGGLGLASSQLIYSHFYHSFKENAYLLALPAVILGIGLLVYRFPISGADQNLTSTHKPTSVRDMFNFFKRSDLRHLYFAQVANQTLMWGTIFILPDALRNLGHIDWVCFGGGHLCFILGCACMMVPAGYLADKTSARRVMLVAGILSCFTFYLILMSEGMPVYLVLASLFVLGASLGIVNPLGVALGNRLVPDCPGTISAFLMGLVWCVSETLGPGGVGLMSSWFGEGGSVKALAILGGFFLVHIYATYRLPILEALPIKADVVQV